MKKQVLQVTPTEPVAAETPAPKAEERPVAAPASTDAKQLYTVTTWHGHEKLNCKLCAWDTLNGPAEILDHIAKTHIAKLDPSILIAKR